MSVTWGKTARADALARLRCAHCADALRQDFEGERRCRHGRWWGAVGGIVFGLACSAPLWALVAYAVWKGLIR